MAVRSLRAGAALLCACMLAACGGGGGGGSGGGGGGGGGGNRAPVFTSAATASVAENTSGAFYTATATDADGNTLTFSISGGADAARFSINAASGALSFVTAPDFEAPNDANTDNVYELTLAVFDGALSATRALAVTVTNVTGVIGARRVGVGFSQPLFLTATGDGGGRVFVVEKGGLIRILDPATGTISATPFLNVSTQISTDGERGLLGLALAPDFAASRTFYVHLTNPGGDIEIRRYLTLPGNLNQADPASADVIMVVEHSARSNHNGGWLGFSNNLLYIAMGDGGGGGDPDLNGQNRNTLLGAMLRIDPRTDAFPADANRDYAIPAGNPFAAGGGAGEIYALGLRNPFRNSFDRANGNLYIGDVGQGAIEEINLARPSDANLNYGWNILEGTSVFAGGSTAGLTPPIAQYGHGAGAFQGRSITGGYVYRGPIAALQGQYFFGDYVNQRIWSLPVSTVSQGTTLTSASFTDRTAAFVPNAGAINGISSFGEDSVGNLYIVDLDGEIFLITETE